MGNHASHINDKLCQVKILGIGYGVYVNTYQEDL